MKFWNEERPPPYGGGYGDCGTFFKKLFDIVA
jgi:hypothetical protein